MPTMGTGDYSHFTFHFENTMRNHSVHPEKDGKIAKGVAEKFLDLFCFLPRQVFLVLLLGLAIPLQAAQTITINTDRGGDDIYGNSADGSGTSHDDVPNQNTLTIASGGIVKSATGGYTMTGTASQNRVIINGGTIKEYARGGESQTTATRNSITINNFLNTQFDDDYGIYGGYAKFTGPGTSTGTVTTYNTVTISTKISGEFSEIAGGYAWNSSSTATTTNNSVLINGGIVGNANSGIYGGYAYSENHRASATNNSTTINGVKVEGDGIGVYGGYAKSESTTAAATAEDNAVTISGGGKVDFEVYGGFAESDSGAAEAKKNSVTIKTGEVGNDIIGGSARSEGNANTATATATNNNVTISSGKVDGFVYGGTAFSNNRSATATNNTVTFNSGTVNGRVYGGDANGENGAIARDNTVTINGGTVDGTGAVGWDYGDVLGGCATSTTGSATARNNTIIINSGTVKGGVTGGFAYNGTSGTATASHNRVIINGGIVKNVNIYGGYAGWSPGGAGFTTNATNNTVTISGKPDLTGSDLYGGYVTGTGDAFTGNTLNVWNYTGTPVASLQNFEFYNFVLPASWQGLEATGKVNFKGPNNKFSSITGVHFMGGGQTPKIGDTITLINAVGGFEGTIANHGKFLFGKKGDLLDVTYLVKQEANKLNLLVENVKTIPESKALSEGGLAGMSVLHNTGNLLANQSGKKGVFVDIAGNWSRNRTGSHVDVAGLSLVTGLGRSVKVRSGQLTWGPFFDYGNGSYDTFNSFTGVNYRNSGNTYHAGGGFLGRIDYCNSFYTEGSIRAGGLCNTFNGGDLKGQAGNPLTYKSSTPYYSAHLGGGRVFRTSNRTLVDLYSKYFWTLREGDSITLSGGDPVDFESVGSHRFRLGGRWNHIGNCTIYPYIGGAWEHEFDGKANASVHGYAIDAPSLSGSTGIGEVGFGWDPFSNLTVDFGFQGYVGTREGATVNLAVGWVF